MELKTNKEKRFDNFYQLYSDDVFKVSLHYTKDEIDAKELTQKVFYNFYLHMDNVNPKCVRAYLLRSTRNLFYNKVRDTKHEVLQGEDIFTEEQAGTMISVEDAYLRDEQRRRKVALSRSILEALREENEDWHDAIVMVYCLEKAQDTVADELGITKEVLYSRLYRAKKWIRKHYRKEYEEIAIFK